MADPPGEDEHRDELPADLDVTQYVGMYTFPDIRRRRSPARDPRRTRGRPIAGISQ